VDPDPPPPGNNRNIHCPKVLQGGKYVGECEICKYYNWLWKQSEDRASRSRSVRPPGQGRAIKPTERYYYNCIVRSQVNPKTEQVEKNVGPKILSVGKMVHKMIVRAIVGAPRSTSRPLGDVTDVKEGRDFKIVKRMVQGANGVPAVQRVQVPGQVAARHQEQVAKWLGNLHDLQALRVLKTPGELEHELKRTWAWWTRRTPSTRPSS
jgi:hypothetical protein